MFKSYIRFQRFSYNFKEVQTKWKSSPSSARNPNNKKFYCLAQFPYPSGSIHLGHARVYFISDSIARYKTITGFNVLHPIGWDSFGLPAENAALQRNISPKQWTENNIKQMKQQLIQLGISFDWDKEIATHSIEYYRWTQLLFTKMLERSLAYKKQSEVNWDPIDKTVLANEQVDSNGMSWRSGAIVEKKVLNQWFLKITDYAERLVEGLDSLDWPTKVKEMQKGWIGLRKGFLVKFKVSEDNGQGEIKESIEVFIESLQDLSLCRLIIVPSSQNVQAIKIGTCINPVTGEEIPIIMIKNPVYDDAQSFAGLPLKQSKVADLARAFSINYQHTLAPVKELGPYNYRPAKIMLLKDWLVSRQRYWGAPIPAIYCQKCGCVPSSLPVPLPLADSLLQNPLTLASFKKCKCPQCGGESTRQSDTLDTFVDSSWYYLRYLNPSSDQMIDKSQNHWMGVDVYVGGIEHAIMHLLYARFVYKVLYDQGLVCEEQPFYRLVDQGLVKGQTFKLKSNGRYITPQQATSNYQDQDVIKTFQKMSKSKYNGVSPLVLTQKYGSDALRLALLSIPYDKDIDFTEADVRHKLDFIARVYTFAEKVWVYKQQGAETDAEVMAQVHKLVNSMESSMEKYNIHVYQARVMELFNILKELADSKVSKRLLFDIFRIFVVALNPISPYLSMQLAQKSSHLMKIEQQWPEIILEEPMEQQLSISLNGRFIKRVKIPKHLTENEADLIKWLKQDPKVSGRLSYSFKTILKRTKNGIVINLVMN